MKLELKHLAPYLPYDIKFTQNEMEYTAFGYATSWYNENGSTYIKGRYLIPSKVYPDNVFTHSFIIDCIKPILRPLRDLTIEIEINGKQFMPIDWFKLDNNISHCDFDKKRNKELIEAIHHISVNDISVYEGVIDINLFPYHVIEKFLEWHFDVFGLIKAGLAIDINTLKITAKA